MLIERFNLRWFFDFMEFYIEGFSLCFYMIGSCKIVVKVDSEVLNDFCLDNHIIDENHGEAETWT